MKTTSTQLDQLVAQATQNAAAAQNAALAAKQNADAKAQTAETDLCRCT